MVTLKAFYGIVKDVVVDMWSLAKKHPKTLLVIVAILVFMCIW